MSIFSSIGRTMNRLPGMGAMTRPISNAMQQIPGMRGAPQAMGMMPPQKGGIGPSQNAPMMQNMAQGVSSLANQPMLPSGDNQVPAVSQGYGIAPPPFSATGSQGMGKPDPGMNRGPMGGFAGSIASRFGGVQKAPGMPMMKQGRGGSNMRQT